MLTNLEYASVIAVDLFNLSMRVLLIISATRKKNY